MLWDEQLDRLWADQEMVGESKEKSISLRTSRAYCFCVRRKLRAYSNYFRSSLEACLGKYQACWNYLVVHVSSFLVEACNHIGSLLKWFCKQYIVMSSLFDSCHPFNVRMPYIISKHVQIITFPAEIKYFYILFFIILSVTFVLISHPQVLR